MNKPALSLAVVALIATSLPGASAVPNLCGQMDSIPPRIQDACEEVLSTEPPNTGMSEIGVLPETSGVKCAGTWTLVAEGKSDTILVGGGVGLFWGFLGWQHAEIDVKMAFEFDCNTEVRMVATGSGGVNRLVNLYRDGVLADARSYTGISPDNSAQAFYAEAYNGGSGHGIVDVGELRPSASIACTSAGFSGENKDAVTGLDAVSARWIDDDGCLPVSIGWTEVEGEAANDLIERVLHALQQ